MVKLIIGEGMKKLEAIIAIFTLLLVTTILIVKVSYSAGDSSITSDSYEISDNVLYAIPTSQTFTVNELLDNLNFPDLIDVQDKNNKRVDSSATVGTGYKVKTSDSTLSVIVMGDVTGDGNINLGDVSLLYNTYKGKVELSGNLLKAGKLTKNSNVTLGDVAKLYNFYKGKTPMSYFSKDHPDGISKTINATYDNVGKLKEATPSVGNIVQTRGYYSANDGGGAKYEILKSSSHAIDNAAYIKLNNGYVARMIIGRKTINIKQFGAKGDGTTDDHEAFTKAFKTAAVTIKIPDGTYNLNGNTVTVNKYTRFIGNGQKNTVVKNGTVRSSHGVRAEDITFDGGASQSLDYIGLSPETGTAIFDVTPGGTKDITYKNCTFKNVMAASFARDYQQYGSGKIFRYDTVTGCTFENLTRSAIYHSLVVDKGVYKNNKFINLGTSETLRGIVSAIFLGDITNNTYTEFNDVIIQNNTFENLITHSNFLPSDQQEHKINANFIAIRGYKAIIDNNKFENLIGYGNDREGIYTKVRDLTISKNEIRDAGLGEGYVCAKPHSGEAYFKINNNKLYGTAGTGIVTYGPGEVSGNEFYMTNSQTGIRVGLSPICGIGANNNFIKVNNNYFNSGIQTTFTIDGETFEKYNVGSKNIAITNTHIPIIVEGNTFENKTSFSTNVSIMNHGNSITVRNNTFKLKDKAGDAISISTTGTANADDAAQNATIVERNKFEVGDSVKALLRTDYEKTNIVSNRTVSFLNNTIDYTGTKGIDVTICFSGDKNKDKLIVKGNTTNSSKSLTRVNSNLDAFEMDNDNFAITDLNYVKP